MLYKACRWCVSALLGLALVCGALPCTAAPSRGELADLVKVAAEETAFVDAVRKFDRQQQSLANWDAEMAASHEEAGEKELAEDKMANARHRLELVREAYDLAVKHYPRNARVQTYYGELLCDCFGEIAGAVRAWKLATHLDPELSTPYNDLAIHYAHTGSYALALQCYDKAIELEPKNPDYLFNLAQMYLVNFPQVQEQRGWTKARVYKAAMRLSRSAAGLAPDDFELVQDYAVNFFAAESFGLDADWTKAAEAWQRTRPLARTSAEIFFTWLNEARVWMRAGDKEAAAGCLKEALNIMPDSPVAQRLLRKVEEDGAAASPE